MPAIANKRVQWAERLEQEKVAAAEDEKWRERWEG